MSHGKKTQTTPFQKPSNSKGDSIHQPSNFKRNHRGPGFERRFRYSESWSFQKIENSHTTGHQFGVPIIILEASDYPTFANPQNCIGLTTNTLSAVQIKRTPGGPPSPPGKCVRGPNRSLYLNQVSKPQVVKST